MKKTMFLTMYRTDEGEIKQRERDYTLPTGWEFGKPTQAQCEDFEELYAKEIEGKDVDGAAKRSTYWGAVVRASVKAGYFAVTPDDVNAADPKDIRMVARFVDAFTTDLTLIPENLS